VCARGRCRPDTGPLGLTPLFLLRRIFGLIATLLVASVVIYGAVYIAPGSPIAFLTGGKPASPADLAILKAQYHLDDPFLTAYLRWLTGVVHGDFGESIVSHSSVVSLLNPRLQTTGFLLVYAAILILTIGIGSGVIAALRPRLGGGIVGVTTVAMATPAFVTAIVLITVFGVGLGWFPSVGDGVGFGGHLKHLTLPAISLALALVAYVSRITRVAVRDELGREHVETARARGLPDAWVLRRHVLRNAAIPISTVAGVSVAALIGVDAVVETAFGLNGLGAFLVQAVQQKDFAVVQAIALLFVGCFVLINTLVDVFYALADPRLAVRGRRR
jgi:peptide/nickel transport system permease protein